MIDKEGKKKIRRILFAKIPIKTILAIEGKSKFISELCKIIPDSSQAYMNIMIEKFRDNGLIRTKKSGRRVYITLTKNGRDFVKILKPVVNKWC